MLPPAHKKKESTETAAACDIARLPEDVLSAAISRTTPLDACNAAMVSKAFLAAADSDAVWSTFLPRDLPPLADGEISPTPPYKKNLFKSRAALMSMWTDKETGAMCYALSARALRIVWADTPRYWRWIPRTDSRFSECAELLDVCCLEIDGQIYSKMLSQNTTYAAYMVFKMADVFYGLDSPFQEATVSVGGSKLTRQVCLGGSNQPGVVLPQRRADAWLELEMGEFYIKEGEDGKVWIGLMGHGPHWKKGLIVQGIEIRPKKSG